MSHQANSMSPPPAKKIEDASDFLASDCIDCEEDQKINLPRSLPQSENKLLNSKGNIKAEDLQEFKIEHNHYTITESDKNQEFSPR